MNNKENKIDAHKYLIHSIKKTKYCELYTSFHQDMQSGI